MEIEWPGWSRAWLACMKTGVPFPRKYQPGWQHHAYNSRTQQGEAGESNAGHSSRLKQGSLPETWDMGWLISTWNSTPRDLVPSVLRRHLCTWCTYWQARTHRNTKQLKFTTHDLAWRVYSSRCHGNKANRKCQGRRRRSRGAAAERQEPETAQKETNRWAPVCLTGPLDPQQIHNHQNVRTSSDLFST